MKPNVLIPMAGLGSRFADAGYTKPKPLIDVNGVPMIEAVVNSLGIDGNYIFIVQKEHSVQYHLLDVLDSIAPGCSIVELDGPTDGAARTALTASHLIDNDRPLIIANSDQIVDWQSKIFSNLVNSWNVVALFEADDPKWSFAKIENNLITEIAEKKVISNSASVGIYGWAKGSDYVKYAKLMIARDIRTNNEFYIAPVYNGAIADGQKVHPFFVEKMYGTGTPEDLATYLEATKND
jgi:dTDP-glucose pyrophosphorylase